MITKAVVLSINKSRTRCKVQMPLFENASSNAPVTAEALVSIVPGLYNNIFVGDIVFVSFEENELERPIILGKLYRGSAKEENTPGGVGIFDELVARTKATLPCSTRFVFSGDNAIGFSKFTSFFATVKYIKWLEQLFKDLIIKLEEHFSCFKDWVLWKLKPENNEIDDGDLDTNEHIVTTPLYQEEDNTCTICGDACIKNNKRTYSKLETHLEYDKLPSTQLTNQPKEVK